MSVGRTYPPPPHDVPVHLRGHLLINTAVLFGSFFFGIGSIFALSLGTRTDVFGSLRLDADHHEAPGWLEQVSPTNYTENDARVFRYEFSFQLPDGTRHRGISYSPKQKNSPAARPGDQPEISVEYSPSNPQRSRIKGTRTAPCSAWVLFVWLFPTVGLAATLGGLAYGAGRIRLLRRAELAVATITSCRQLEDSEQPGGASGLAVGVDGVNVSIPEIPLWKDPEPADPAVEPSPKALRRQAWHKALAFWLQGMIGLGVMVGWSWLWAGRQPRVAVLGPFFGVVAVFVTGLAFLVYFVYSQLGGLIWQKAQLAKGGSVEDFLRVQQEMGHKTQEIAKKLAPVGVGCGVVVAVAVSLWVGMCVGLLAGFGVLMLLPWLGMNQGEQAMLPVFGTVGVMGLLAAGVTFRIVVRWGKRREARRQASPAVTETNVECTYEFRTLGGDVIEGKDKYPLPRGPDDWAAQTVLYDPARVRHNHRLHGLTPPVVLADDGRWISDAGPWWVVKFIVVVALYTVGPLIGLLTL
jgi:Protein of unknown function (DUF3592)